MIRFFAALFLFIVVHLLLLFPVISKAQTPTEFAYEKDIQLDLPVDDVRYTIKISDLKIAGSAITQEEIFAALDAGDVAQIRQLLNADSIDIEHIQIDVRLAADGYVTLNQVDFEQVQLNQLVEGRAESAKVITYRESVSSFSGMDDVASDDRNSSFDVEFQNLDLIGFFLEKGMFTESADADANLFDQAKVAKFRFSSVDANCEGENVIMEGPVSPKITDVPGDVTVAFLSHGVEDEEYLYSDQFSSLVIDATISEFLTMNFRSLTAEETVCNTSEEIGLATISVGSIALGTVVDGRFDDVLINDLVIDNGPYSNSGISLDRVRFGTLDINPAIERISALTDVDWAELLVSQPYIFMPEFSGFEVINFQTREAGEIVSRVGKFAVALGDYFQAKPTRVRAEIFDFKRRLGGESDNFDLEPDDPISMLKNISLGVVVDLGWLKTSEQLHINEFSLLGDPMMDFTFTAQFEGATELLFSDVPEVIITSLLTLKLDQVSLNVATDGELYELFQDVAASMNLPSDPEEDQQEDTDAETDELEIAMERYSETFSNYIFPDLTEDELEAILEDIAAGERDLSVKIAAKNNAVPVPMLQFLVKDIEQLKRYFEVKDVNYDLKN
ncbi:hypothetical protein [Maritalea sp. S77]|uniref:hypothetical protein n=1 Tax=Maritalea sp. S77 TaxID=3415125 RepID=UPI003C7B9E89